MELFITNAYAQGAGGAGGGLITFLPLILIFVLFYFMLIRPQQKRAKEHQAMIGAIKKGDEIVTNGGLLGKVSDVGDHFVGVEIAANTSVHIQRSSIAQLMPKGTIKSA